VIVVPKDQKEYQAMVAFLQAYALVQPTADMQCIGWVTENRLRLCVGFNAFLGKTCQIHVAMEPGYEFTPKEMLEAVFSHAFVTLKRHLLLGIVNSNNRRAMRYDRHLGFKEVTRLKGMHDDAGDVVVFSMTQEDCRYLPSVPVEQQPVEAEAA